MKIASLDKNVYTTRLEKLAICKSNALLAYTGLEPLAWQREIEWLRKTLAQDCLGLYTSLIGLALTRSDHTVWLEGIVHDQIIWDHSWLIVPTISGRETKLDWLFV